MKRFSQKKLALLVGLTFFVGSISATTYSNKTFLMPRPILRNMAMEYTTWHKVTRNAPKNQWGTNIQATGFYQESNNGTELGKYFGVNKKNCFVISGENADDVHYDFIFHDNENVNNETSAIVKFEPQQKAYGVRLDCFQNLDFLLKNLYLKVAAPFVEIQNDINMQICNTAELFSDCKLAQYFAGKKIFHPTDNDENRQAPLTKAKIDGERNTSGVADIDLILGYKAIDKARYQIKFNAGLTIPTGSKVTGEYLFEPIRGNGKHWALGCGVDMEIDFYKKKNWGIKVINAYNYRYLFKDPETRTVPLGKTVYHENTVTYNINLSQYYLLGLWEAPANTDLIPAANILTLPLDVTPGSELEGLLNIGISYKKFIFDLGYNVFFKQAESLKLKDKPFEENQYGIIKTDFDTTGAITTLNSYENKKLLSIQDLDFAAVSTPSQLTHKIYGAFGYTWDKDDYSALLGLGGSYEFATSNNELETWALWGKVGISW